MVPVDYGRKRCWAHLQQFVESHLWSSMGPILRALCPPGDGSAEGWALLPCLRSQGSLAFCLNIASISEKQNGWHTPRSLFYWQICILNLKYLLTVFTWFDAVCIHECFQWSCLPELTLWSPIMIIFPPRNRFWLEISFVWHKFVGFLRKKITIYIECIFLPLYIQPVNISEEWEKGKQGKGRPVWKKHGLKERVGRVSTFKGGSAHADRGLSSRAKPEGRLCGHAAAHA